MKLSLIACTVLVTSFAFLGCAADDTAPETDSIESDVTAGTAPLAAGKYVSRGRILMIYGACSGENFLGDDAATGAIENGVMRVPEGNVCGGYTLTAKKAGVIEVKWNYERDASAHRDPKIAKYCSASEGTYEQTEASAYVEPRPGTYLKNGTKLVIRSGCAVESTLGDAVSSVLEPELVDGKPKAVIRAVEGNVCSAYTLESAGIGKVNVTWLPAANASASRDPEVARFCKSSEGIYTTTR